LELLGLDTVMPRVVLSASVELLEALRPVTDSRDRHPSAVAQFAGHCWTRPISWRRSRPRAGLRRVEWTELDPPPADVVPDPEV